MARPISVPPVFDEDVARHARHTDCPLAVGRRPRGELSVRPLVRTCPARKGRRGAAHREWLGSLAERRKREVDTQDNDGDGDSSDEDFIEVVEE